MTDATTLLQLAARCRRMAAHCRTAAIARKFEALAEDYEEYARKHKRAVIVESAEGTHGNAERRDEPRATA
jgi:hypothetical protein